MDDIVEVLSLKELKTTYGWVMVTVTNLHFLALQSRSDLDN